MRKRTKIILAQNHKVSDRPAEADVHRVVYLVFKRWSADHVVQSEKTYVEVELEFVVIILRDLSEVAEGPAQVQHPNMSGLIPGWSRVQTADIPSREIQLHRHVRSFNRKRDSCCLGTVLRERHVHTGSQVFAPECKQSWRCREKSIVGEKSSATTHHFLPG